MFLILLIAAAVGFWFWITSQNQGSAAAQPSGFSNVTTQSNPGNSALQQMAQAIYQFEGGGKPGATNSHNNNPGNIGGGGATYPTQQDGWNALYSYIQNHVQSHPDWTFTNFFSYYLTGNPNASQPSAQGNPVNYANYVAGQLGVSPDTPVSQVVGA